VSPLFTRRQLLGSGAALALSACATPPSADDAAEYEHVLEGLVDFEGVPIELPTLEGRVTVIDFWASWCAPCRQGFRYLDQLYRTYAGRGFQLLGISADEDARAARTFVSRMRPRFDTMWDRSGLVRARFAVQALPTTVLIDPGVRMVHRTQGFDPGAHKVLESHVRRLLESA
jgi:thiol-disulfide isomerase/thioredoxin